MTPMQRTRSGMAQSIDNQDPANQQWEDEQRLH